ncbi:SGNH/GDSL hydrolase family protein [Lacisediminihabitans profunda]|uniref:SGNH/GDSL hydrolase family protein n=1 Tax=Lacisediminihabitans profunda TaxID=2594790 RepID=A0A5C8UW88_9MICO|nr:SGNH/GDSL hydrolase family protein [Lacisediminihabitans profunda]TXN32293.1 SGNH/GDSL hydrolase family protein [Lacisediminihabitans profunda]
MHIFIRWALVPLIRVWSLIVERRLADVPRPADESRVPSSEMDCDRVLIFGRGPALGLGVLSHKLALSGSLARALFLRTGHAIDVTVVADSTIAVGSAIPRLASLPLASSDAIVLTFGAKDATTLADPGRWDRQMRALLRFLDDDCPDSVHIFLLGIQPVRSISVFNSPLGAIADLHARELNAATEKICAEFSRALFVPLTAVPHPSPDRFRSAADYRHWGEILAAQMSSHLEGKRQYADPAEHTVP